MEKFTKGSKLKRFDLYMKDEQDRNKMAHIKKEVQKDYEMSEKHLAELKRRQMAQLQKERLQANIKSMAQAEQNQSNFMKGGSDKKNYAFKAV